MSSKLQDEIQRLAAVKDPHTQHWAYGRRQIVKLTGATEWMVRNVMQQVREPTQADTLKKQLKQMSVPEIVVNVPKFTKAKHTTKDCEQWVIASDFHAPYQHQPSCELLYSVINEIQPDKVVLLGDVINLDLFSKYDHVPGRPDSWMTDVSEAGKILGSVAQASGGAELLWVSGNHEERLRKYLMRHDPLLYSVLDMCSLFKLVGNDGTLKNWSYVDASEIFYPELDLVLAHGNKVRGKTGTTAYSHMEYLWMSVVLGHCHRLGITRKSSGRTRYYQKQAVFGVEAGCLCNYDLDYTNGATVDWQHGFVVLTINKSTEGHPIVNPELVEIFNNKAVFRAKTYRA
jgi:predicted phosphodiesterase